MSELLPQHRSAIGKRPRPVGMESVQIPTAIRESVESLVLGIFTDMSNSGATLPQILSAIYLSGMAHAKAVASKDKP